MPKQSTLGAFGFTKTTKNGTAVRLPRFADNEHEHVNKSNVECPKCNKKFLNQQGLSVHLKCKHPSYNENPKAAAVLVEATKRPEVPEAVRLEEPEAVRTEEPEAVRPEEPDAVRPEEPEGHEAEEVHAEEATEPAEVEAASTKAGAPPKIERRKGQKFRYARSNMFKAQVIAARNGGATPEELVARYKINKCQVSKWMKQEEEIIQAATGDMKKLFKIRKAVKYNSLFKEMKVVFLAAREQGRAVDFNWLWSRGRVIYRQQEGQNAEQLKQHVVTNFIKRMNLKLRRVQRNKKLPKEALRGDLQKWHATTRERLVRTGLNDNYDPKYGRFLPEQRFNVDQSPLPFAIDTKKTYEEVKPKDPENRHKKVWVQQPGSGLEKRQCTLQICFRPTGTQPRLAVIFRGQGKRISQVERNAWHKDVDVYFQKCAWADTEFCVDWAKHTLAPAIDVERFALFQDNLEGQIANLYKETIADLFGVNWYGLKNATDYWQPVDAGYAMLLKILIKNTFHDWLDDDENAEKWYGHDGKFSASERRILITHWSGNAYNTLSSPKYDEFRWRLFQKTGCLLTADGSDDELIQPEGLPNYVVPPPALIDAMEEVPVATAVEAAVEDDEEDVEPDDFEGDNEDDAMVVDARGEEGDDGWVFNLLAEMNQ